MTTDARYPTLSVRLRPELKRQWEAHCKSQGVTSSALIQATIEQILEAAGKAEPVAAIKRSREPTEPERKERCELLLTTSEKAGVRERADLEGCSMRRFMVDAIRAALTREPQFGMRAVEVLGDSNYQLMAIGRNINQIARRLNEGRGAALQIEKLDALHGVIQQHIRHVSDVTRASLERWPIE
ncbi:plasmid mobilization relaxosome protein MobC [Stenotrophomonas maltophilia]|uniref:plasmid mobilization relaxosome protein MobC n=1 Tax=Stenotrophomonas maltophilia TaxID=40324 RepID=UPI000DA842E7|nr:plasmid mobilization relaxosome protein MobC [Stenotrophomonas maltophilia]PZT16819.1 hypothetical protein A7X86_13660 [Stenotrophomonas maltophilia]UVH75370.1 MobC family plasmid mobilization relaxosome protein [Stenotrophomonas maltophilia]HDS1667626.1 plasmid mobilization relaxosome protein MobC [Stenotrophomonas maltophilia]